MAKSVNRTESTGFHRYYEGLGGSSEPAIWSVAGRNSFRAARIEFG
jgi:hypothetical protein